jgi:TDG/mug DNA glycosylase family protein
VGINPGLRSGAEGHHFAGNGNPFWRFLHASGLTPRLLAFSEDQALGTFGIALTNLCPLPTRTAAELSAMELARGRRTLARKVDRLRPGVVAFVGLTITFGWPAATVPAPSRNASRARACSWSRTRVV